MLHLDDPALNAYLDSGLVPGAAAEAAAHLAACPDCAARLDKLSRLVAELQSLPDLPLSRDLSRSVLAAIQNRPAAIQARPAANVPPALGRAARLAFGLQALAAAGAVAAAIPLALAALPAYVWAIPPIQLSAPLSNFYSALLVQWAGLLGAVQSLLERDPLTAYAAQLPPLSSLALAVTATAATLLFIIGNGVLLRTTLLRPLTK